MRFIICFLFLVPVALSQNFILKNITVIPMNQEVTIPACNVYISNNKIEKIESYPSKESTKGYTVIECTGKYLIPGLVNMHAHLPDNKDAIELNQYLRLNLAAGVTTLRSMRGESSHLAIRDSVNFLTKKLSPEIYVSYVFTENDSLLTKDSIEKVIIFAKNKKYDFIKYLGGINETNFKYLIEACKINNLSIAGHAYDNSLEKSISSGFTSIEHYQPILAAYIKDSLGIKKTFDYMRLKSISFCPTLSFYNVYSFAFSEKTLLQRSGMEYLPNKVKNAWLKEYNTDLQSTKDGLKNDFEIKYVNVYQQQFINFNKVLKQAVDLGVPVLLSPDDGIFNVPGFGMFEEMKLYKNAGLSNYQILKCATYNAALCLKQQKLWGSVEVGKKANLLILNANPLHDIKNIKQVHAILLNGTFYLQNDLLK